MNSYKGFIYAIISSAAFGLGPTFAKIAYMNGSNSTSLLMFRFLIAFILLLAYLLIKRVSIKIDRKQLLMLFLIGILGYTITTETLFLSYVYLDGGLATTLHFTYPVIICVFSFFAYKEKVSRGKIISIITASLGVYSLVAFESTTLNTFGVILALISGVTYAGTVIGLGLKPIKLMDNKIATMYVSFGAFIGMAIYGLTRGEIAWVCNLPVIGSYFGIAIISTIVPIVLLLKAIESIGATSATILATFEPIVSIICGVIFFSEKLSFALIIGTLLIIASAIILAKDKG
ncbi:MAG: DMT family transporter [Clostridium sp.]|uniref:DMT family transporter n=1 Tax=Clostridium sp. TaxID=1506 RepID=UPI002FC65278